MTSRLRIRAVEVVTTRTSRIFDFNRPLTALIGPVGTGKSSLLMLIKHATGGRAALTPAVRANVTRVVLDLQVEDTRLTLARSVPDPSGIVEILDPYTRDTEAQLPIRSRDGQETISDRLLERLGIPRERIPTRRRGATADTVAVTFQNLMAYLYVEAVDIDRSIAGHTETYTDRPRRALFEFLFGLNDADLAAQQRREGALNSAIAAHKAEVAAVRSFLGQTETPPEERIDEERRAILLRLNEINTALEALASQSSSTGQATDVLFAELDQAAIHERQLQIDAAQRAEAVAARRATLAQLELDSLRAQQAHVAGHVLGALEFEVCPRCLQHLDHSSVADDQCRLCRQPEPASVAASAVDDETRHRYENQIAETRHLLSGDEDAAARATDRAMTARLHLHTVRQRVDQLTRSRTAPLLTQTAALSGQHATMLARLARLDEMTTTWERFKDIELRLRADEGERKEVRSDIKRRKQAMTEARARVARFDSAFQREIELIGVPGVQEAHIDRDDYLPRIDGAAFDEIQASGGGVATAVHVAYNIALITTALDDPNVTVPSLLIIDSPQNAIGRSPTDVELSQRIYDRIANVTNAAGRRIQMIIADNALPPPPPRADWTRIHVIEFGYEDRAMIPDVWHSGPAAARTRVEDAAVE
ncbi:hypothetical protein ACIBP4_12150 [Micromonospora maritima]|uniref:AAA domain-containing protein n=1 Tax=Micromonospora maritima TaxID=986711 RepID=A0ABW7ZLC9_9ACTN